MDSTTSKRGRRKPRSPKPSTYVPVDPAGNPIDVLFSHFKRPKERPLTPSEAKRHHAPLNSQNAGFRLLR